MWRVLASLTLAGLCMALPQAQQNDSNLDYLIASVFAPPSAANATNLDTSKNEVFGTPKPTAGGHGSGGGNGGGTILGTQNIPTARPGDCECVPYYQCRDGKVVDNGFGLIDIRALGPCANYLEVCCKPADRTKPGENITPRSTRRTGCGRRNPPGVGFKIIGQSDNEAQFGEFPWMVAILKEEIIGENGEKFNVYQCGGSLIHRQAVLTAAHCVNGRKPSELRIRAGEWDTQTKTEIFEHQDRDVKTVVVHKDYNPGVLYNDFAILILDEPVDYAENVDIVCLPDQNVVFDGSRCFSSGWGKNLFGQEGRYQVILKKVELPIVKHNVCQHLLRNTRLGKYFNLDQSFICAGGQAGIDTCTGDGGSPLVCPVKDDPQRYLQAGIVAWGIGCGDMVPGVYANVAHVRDWIDERMAFHHLDNTVYVHSSSTQP